MMIGKRNVIIKAQGEQEAAMMIGILEMKNCYN